MAKISPDQFDNTVATYSELAGVIGKFDGMSIYVRDSDRYYTWDSPTNMWILPKVDASQVISGWLPCVNSYSNLASLSPNDGDVVLVKDENTLYRYIQSSSTWIVPAAYAKGFTSGCRLQYNSASTIGIGSGVIEIRGSTVQRTSKLTLTWSNIENGTTKQASTWYYVYLTVDPSNKQQFVGFISTTVPSKDTYGNTINPDSVQAKYHPTLNARFIGSFQTDTSQSIVSFRVVGNYVSLIASGYNYLIQNASVLAKKIPVSTVTAVPQTTSLLTLYMENTGGTANYKYIGTLDAYFYRFKDGSVDTICPTSPTNLCAISTMSASSNNNNAGNTSDGDTATVWTAGANNNQWVECNFGSSKSFDSIKVVENGSLITSYNVQYYNGTTWINITTGTTLGALNINFPDITAQRVRILINTATNKPSISEFMIWQKDVNDCIYYKLDGDSVNIGIHGYYEDI